MRVISSEVRIHAPVDRVWSILTDLAAYPTWNPFIREASGDLVTGGRMRITLQSEGGSRVTFHPRIQAVRAAQELRWIGHLGIPGLFDGEHRFTLSPGSDGVLFRQSEEFRGLLVPFVWKRLERTTGPMFSRMNDALKARAEGGTR